MKAPLSVLGDFPLTAHVIIFISITHNHMMVGRTLSFKSLFMLCVFMVGLWCCKNLVGETSRSPMKGSGYGILAGDGQRLRNRHSGEEPGMAEAVPSGDWDTTVLSSSITVRPECSNRALLLILITSAPANFQMRASIRKTWCAKSSKDVPLDVPGSRPPASSNSTASYLCIFLIGKSGDVQVDSQVQEEIDIYDDILYGEYRDTYRNLTFKVLSSFLWASVNCGARFVLKTDDDCFVTVGTFLNFLSFQEMTTGVYVGRVFRSQSQTKVIRNPQSKWSVSPDMFGPEYYPPYASGTGYLLSSDVMQKIIKYSQHFKPFPNEDAYVGVLAEQLHVKPIHSWRFVLVSTQWTVCNFRYLLVMHKVSADRQLELQALADRAGKECRGRVFLSGWE